MQLGNDFGEVTTWGRRKRFGVDRGPADPQQHLRVSLGAEGVPAQGFPGLSELSGSVTGQLASPRVVAVSNTMLVASPARSHDRRSSPTVPSASTVASSSPDSSNGTGLSASTRRSVTPARAALAPISAMSPRGTGHEL